jgi:hypothetical protein
MNTSQQTVLGPIILRSKIPIQILFPTVNIQLNATKKVFFLYITCGTINFERTDDDFPYIIVHAKRHKTHQTAHFKIEKYVSP